MVLSRVMVLAHVIFLENFYCLILHGLNGVNSAELFERGTEVNQVYSNLRYAKEHRIREKYK